MDDFNEVNCEQGSDFTLTRRFCCGLVLFLKSGKGNNLSLQVARNIAYNLSKAFNFIAPVIKPIW